MKLNNIKTKLKQINNCINFLSDTDDIDAQEKALFSLAIISEKLYIATRQLLIENISINENIIEEFQNAELEDMGINISEKDDILFIDMPIILPLKKLKSNRLKVVTDKDEYLKTYEFCNAFLEVLDYAFRKYLKDHRINKNKYSKSTFQYVNYFDESNLPGFIPDTDNYEYKQITDLVIHYVSNLDDSFNNVDSVEESENDVNKITIRKDVIIERKNQKPSFKMNYNEV